MVREADQGNYMPPRAPKIMLIRHAEKPNGGIAGVNESGEPNARHLTVRGWQRAGALARLFAPAERPVQHALLATPEHIFASAAADDPAGGNSRSHRSQETVIPLAELLGIEVNLSFRKGQEKALAKAAQACAGPVLIAWQHENIATIVDSILGEGFAPLWPSERFDMIFVLSLKPSDDRYSFAQVPQRVLAGDSPHPI